MVYLCNFAFAFLIAAAQAKWIIPGARWRDEDGDLINAHAGGVILDHDTGRFFWFGEYKVEGQVEGGGVSVYSSIDLVTWKNEGIALGTLITKYRFESKEC